MKSLFNGRQARQYRDPLALRAYTSRLLGQNPSLVLHGGGNTSVKAQIKNLLGETIDVLYVKGSGWDLATIEPQGFAPVRMNALSKMARLKNISDAQMVKEQRAAMTDPYAPNPSVEAILHAIIPFRFVDHTHADAVVAVTNTPQGRRSIDKIYGNKVIVIPYVMPGFLLAKKVYEMTRNIDWRRYEGMVLMHHGIFSFHDEAQESYERMIRLVSKAERFIARCGQKKKIHLSGTSAPQQKNNLLDLAKLRKTVSKASGKALIARWNESPKASAFSRWPKIKSIATRGPLTPDHVIRTKPIPVVLSSTIDQDIQSFSSQYDQYFKRFANGHLTRLDLAPRWAVWPGHGIVCFGETFKDARITEDIAEHTMEAIIWAESLGGWKALPAKDIFDVEYWELEQVKLKGKKSRPLDGKIALVTGAASGIGKACAQGLAAQGALVGALDIDRRVETLFAGKEIKGITCDLTKDKDIASAIETIVRQWGGIDIVVSNAGIFPVSAALQNVDEKVWQKSLDINLTGHQKLIKAIIPYLQEGIDPTIIIMASKNVPAPGPGAAAYSVAKAGLTQLGRLAALELAQWGIRVNMIHPNQVFDTAIWSPNVLKERAKHYKMSVTEYKTNNLLKTEIKSTDVAQLVCALAGNIFAKTTGAQIPLDGGNERVI
jgi:rhamnose utilization protein RhaD (predicted bifunctional aldolase and dehydrogenase)/NAD(P)-dependent dehydrogenase (short-subunit alcohol dehydrogenase family)